MKIRNDSTLATLTQEQQAQVYDWLQTLGYTETLNRIAAPPPDGLGLKTHRATLHGFFKRYSKTVRSEDIAAAKDNPQNRSNPEDLSVLVSDAEQSYVHAGHQLATGPLNSGDFVKVGRWLQSHHDAQLKREYLRIAEQNAAIAQKKATFVEQRLQLEREKFQFNAARLALIHFAKLQLIARDRTADDEARIQAAAALIFQPVPTPSKNPTPVLPTTDQRQPTPNKVPNRVPNTAQSPSTPPSSQPSSNTRAPINTGLQSGGLAASPSQTTSAVSSTPPTNPSIHSSRLSSPRNTELQSPSTSLSQTSSQTLSNSISPFPTAGRTLPPNAPSASVHPQSKCKIVTAQSSLLNDSASSFPSVEPKKPLVPSLPSVNSVLSVVNPPSPTNPLIHSSTNPAPERPRPLVLPNFVEIKPPPPSVEPPSVAELDLKRRVDDYTLARHHEFLTGRSETEHVHCPCGHKDLPCPEHGDFEYTFWGAKPDESSYISTLHSKGLPYTSPKHIIEERERAQRKQAGLARLKKEDPDGSKLRERAKLYAIRRFRTADGPRYCGDVPDDHVWKTQCPCGAELPCDAHDGLETELRHVHPLDVDYQKALAREGIPIFVPAQLIAKPKPKTG